MKFVLLCKSMHAFIQINQFNALENVKKHFSFVKKIFQVLYLRHL